jgi:hypothetical protein
MCQNFSLNAILWRFTSLLTRSYSLRPHHVTFPDMGSNAITIFCFSVQFLAEVKLETKGY